MIVCLMIAKIPNWLSRRPTPKICAGIIILFPIVFYGKKYFFGAWGVCKLYTPDEKKNTSAERLAALGIMGFN